MFSPRTLLLAAALCPIYATVSAQKPVAKRPVTTTARPVAPAPVAVIPPCPRQVVLPSATPIQIELAETLPYSHELTENRVVKMRVVFKVVINGHTLIRHQAFAQGKIVRVTPPTHNFPATVTLRTTLVQTADDQLIALQPTDHTFKGVYPNESFQVMAGAETTAYTANNEIIQLENK